MQATATTQPFAVVTAPKARLFSWAGAGRKVEGGQGEVVVDRRGGKTRPLPLQLELALLPRFFFFTRCEFCMNPAALKFPSGAVAAHCALQIAALLFRVLLRDAEANWNDDELAHFRFSSYVFWQVQESAALTCTENWCQQDTNTLFWTLNAVAVSISIFTRSEQVIKSRAFRCELVQGLFCASASW